jgi:predicted nuclease of predicted toxin-antitoxin system
MAKFILDVNVPQNIITWENDDFEFQILRDRTASDNDIWHYAKKNNLTIVTKDSDFSNRIIQSKPPPKVIHLKIGNMKLKDFNTFIVANWKQIEELSADYKLVRVYFDTFEAIN